MAIEQLKRIEKEDRTGIAPWIGSYSGLEKPLRGDCIMANIQGTTNYDRFELFEFNRDVGKTTALERSMLAYGWHPYPMHVVKNGSGKLKIKAGHHRFHVARKLGIPCKYVIAEDQGETIQELEVATRPWTLQDYLASYCRVGNEHYINVKNYLELTGIPIQCAISMLAGQTAASGNQNKKVQGWNL